MCEARLVYAALRIFKNIDVLVEHEAKASLIRRHIEIEGSRPRNIFDLSLETHPDQLRSVSGRAGACG